MQCGSNLRQAGLAFQIYTVANKGSLPPGFWIVDPNTSPATVINWTSLICSMMDKNGAVTNAARDTAGGVTTHGFRKTLLCPEVTAIYAEFDPNDISVTHYLGHPRLLPVLGSADNWMRTYGGDPNAVLKCYKIGRLKRSAEIVYAL